MALKLMYLTNIPNIAQIAETCGVDRIFLDLELRGKEARQGHLDTVISHNDIRDVAKLKAVLHSAALLVRVNSLYDDSAAEIDRVIADGADVVMLPYFKTAQEVKAFLDIVGGRAKTCLLCETPEAVAAMDEILQLPGIDEIHIGLNDLHLGYKMTFMFQLVADGTVDMLCKKFREKGIAYGFGGVGRLGGDVPLPAENIVDEHYRLGSQMVILSRAFCNTTQMTDLAEVRNAFASGVKDLRAYERIAAAKSEAEQAAGHLDTQKRVETIVKTMLQKRTAQSAG
ncbi:MAG: aldolase/citrate lyase family protein [Candidatus Fimenecus sp.]